VCDFSLVKSIESLDEVRSKSIKLCDSPIPFVLSFETDNLAEICVDSFHDEDMAVRLVEHVHGGFDGIVIHALVKIGARKFCNLFDEVDLAEDTGKVMAACVCIGSDHHGLF
jgi:thiamine biosynthesis protein ThiC